MREIVLITLILSGSLSFGQSRSVNQLREVVIQTGDTVFKTRVRSTAKEERIDIGKRYYWYGQGRVFSNIGGSGGKLLHGSYQGFVDGQLVVSGEFRNGLKNGIWSVWKSDGTLINQTHWKNGNEIVTQRRTRRAERRSDNPVMPQRYTIFRTVFHKKKNTIDA